VKSDIYAQLGLRPTEYILKISGQLWPSPNLAKDNCSLADYNIQKNATLDIKLLHPTAEPRVDHHGLLGGTADHNSHDEIDERLKKKISELDSDHGLQLQRASDSNPLRREQFTRVKCMDRP